MRRHVVFSSGEKIILTNLSYVVDEPTVELGAEACETYSTEPPCCLAGSHKEQKPFKECGWTLMVRLFGLLDFGLLILLVQNGKDRSFRVIVGWHQHRCI